jgi:hypothetical protein
MMIAYVRGARLSSYALDLTHLIHGVQASIMRCVEQRTTTKARVPQQGHHRNIPSDHYAMRSLHDPVPE